VGSRYWRSQDGAVEERLVEAVSTIGMTAYKTGIV
jgi:hypothetical protein